MNAEKLKASILKYAIQGKLVKQNEYEGDAEQVYQRIHEEKTKLINKGVIKRVKKSSEITTNDITLSIPKTWRWIKLSEVCYLINGPKVNNVSLPYLETRYLRGKSDPKIKSSGRFIDENQYAILVDGQNSGEIFITEEKGILGSTFKRLIINKAMYHEYILYLLRYYQTMFRKQKRGAAIPHLDKKLFNNLVIGIPPFKEQKRIVEKIEELMPYVDQYDKAYTEVEELNKKFPDEMQKSILQYAIQGKLVDQREEEGTAEDLYQKIQQEKNRIIQEGKIRKSIKLPEITKNEVPFNLPEKWKWVRLGNIMQIINGDRGKNYPSKDKLSNTTGIPFISAINIKNQKISDENLLYMNEEQFKKLKSGKLQEGDLVLCIRGSLGKNGRYYYKRGAIASSLVILRSYLNVDYIYLFIMQYINTQLFSDEISKYNNGTAQPNLGARDLAKFIIPLPPLKEQKRIVDKIEQTFQYINKLRDELH